MTSYNFDFKSDKIFSYEKSEIENNFNCNSPNDNTIASNTWSGYDNAVSSGIFDTKNINAYNANLNRYSSLTQKYIDFPKKRSQTFHCKAKNFWNPFHSFSSTYNPWSLNPGTYYKHNQEQRQVSRYNYETSHSSDVQNSCFSLFNEVSSDQKLARFPSKSFNDAGETDQVRKKSNLIGNKSLTSSYSNNPPLLTSSSMTSYSLNSFSPPPSTVSSSASTMMFSMTSSPLIDSANTNSFNMCGLESQLIEIMKEHCPDSSMGSCFDVNASTLYDNLYYNPTNSECFGSATSQNMSMPNPVVANPSLNYLSPYNYTNNSLSQMGALQPHSQSPRAFSCSLPSTPVLTSSHRNPSSSPSDFIINHSDTSLNHSNSTNSPVGGGYGSLFSPSLESTFSFTDSFLSQDVSEEKYSRKVFVGGLPPDIDEDEITSSFRRFGSLVVDWPHKAESKSYFPPKGYAFLLFYNESSVHDLIEACYQENRKYFLCLSSPTIKDKAVQIRPWLLSDADFVLDGSQALDPRKTIFVGGVPRPLRAFELALIMDRLYGGVCYAGIDTDPELKYPKGAGRVAFGNQQSYVAAISARFVQLQHGEIDKRVEVKPYVLDDQMCDECGGSKSCGKYAPFFCSNITCLQYFCESCWSVVHSRPGKEFHKPLVKESGDRPRTLPFRWY